MAVRAPVAFEGGGEVGPEAYRADSAVEGAAGEWRIVGRDDAAFGGPLAEVASPAEDGDGDDHRILRAARIAEGAVGHQGVA